MDYRTLMDSPFPRIAAFARGRFGGRCIGELSRCVWETGFLPPINSGNFRLYTGEAANVESDRRAAAYDVSKKALAEIKRRLKEAGGKVKRPAKPRLCAQCQATLTAA